MAIVALKKITLCGLLADKAEVLEQLQRLGCSHLIALSSATTDAAGEHLQQTAKTLQALKYLNQCANKRHQVQQHENFDAAKVVERTLAVQAEYLNGSEERDFLAARIEEVKPWGDFSFAELRGLMLWFYIVPKRLMNKVDQSLTYQVVATDNLHCFVVVIAESEPLANTMPVPRTHTGKIPLSQLQHNLQQLELRLEDLQAERESLTRWITLVSLSLYRTQDREALTDAMRRTLDTDTVFVLQAWIPDFEVSSLRRFAEQHLSALLVEEPKPEDSPPTLLHNQALLSGGEDITSFYQTPAYHDWDPSPVVFASFALFFAMILSDAGYAIALMALLALKWRSIGSTRSGSRLRVLALITLSLSLLWGLLVGSYFGYSPEPGSWLAAVKLLDLNDFDSMMRLSVAVGTLHLALANLIKAWQKRRRKTAWSALGWSLAVCAGYGLWYSFEQQNAATEQLAYAGLALASVLILLFSGEGPVKNPMDFANDLLSGVKQLSGVTKLFGDVLSYMRLFALGLASASLAITFNQLAGQISQSVPGAGLFLSLLVLIFGHGLNLALCLMSGVVHGLRLNFIEFYNWSVSDEGYPFKAFAKKGGV